MTAPFDDQAEISVSILSALWPSRVADVAEIARGTASAGIRAANGTVDDIGVAIVLGDDHAVRDLNRTWRGKDTATNVLSFPATEIVPGQQAEPPFPGAPIELGDVILAAETCIQEAEQQRKPFVHHMQHLIVHGVLHLFGYDHVDDADAERMERLEIDILAGLGIPDPYAEAHQRRIDE